MKGLGATHIIDRKSVAILDLPCEVKKVIDVPVQLVYDAVSAADTQETGYEILAEGGDLVILFDSQVKNPVGNKSIRRVVGNVQIDSNRPFGRVLYSKLTKFLEDGTIVVCQIVLFISAEAESFLFSAE